MIMIIGIAITRNYLVVVPAVNPPPSNRSQDSRLSDDNVDSDVHHIPHRATRLPIPTCRIQNSDSHRSKPTRMPSSPPTHARWRLQMMSGENDSIHLSSGRFSLPCLIPSSSHQGRDVDEHGDVPGRIVDDSEWIGMASIIGPSDAMMASFVIAPFKEAGVSVNWEMYGLYSVWVHPAHRGKGVGARLVNACLEWARTNVDIKFASENSGDLEKVVVLLVNDNNVTGHALYSRTGFTDVEGVPVEEGQTWMLAKV